MWHFIAANFAEIHSTPQFIVRGLLKNPLKHVRYLLHPCFHAVSHFTVWACLEVT